jgi:hypothetical protein
LGFRLFAFPFWLYKCAVGAAFPYPINRSRLPRSRVAAPNKESQSRREKKEKKTDLVSIARCLHPTLPVEPWSRSSVTQEKLEELMEEGFLRPITDAAMPEWIAPGAEVDVPNPPAGYVLSFMAFYERGLGILASQFLRALPVWYGVELHNFNPNSIS